MADLEVGYDSEDENSQHEAETADKQGKIGTVALNLLLNFIKAAALRSVDVLEAYFLLTHLTLDALLGQESRYFGRAQFAELEPNPRQNAGLMDISHRALAGTGGNYFVFLRTSLQAYPAFDVRWLGPCIGNWVDFTS